MSRPKSSRIGRAGQYRTEVFVPALGSALGLADLRLVLDLLRVYYPAIQGVYERFALSACSRARTRLLCTRRRTCSASA